MYSISTHIKDALVLIKKFGRKNVSNIETNPIFKFLGETHYFPILQCQFISYYIYTACLILKQV